MNDTRRTTPARRGIRRALTAVAIATALIAGGASGASAIPPEGASPNTPGTWSTVSPSTVSPGGRIDYTVGGFPAGETLYIKINDGALCTDSSHGACVYQTQRIPSSGVVTGYLTLPADLAPGQYWLRFLASTYVDPNDTSAGTLGFTHASPDVTVQASTSGGGTAGGSSGGSSSGGTSGGSSGGQTAAEGEVLAAAPMVESAEPATVPAAPAASGADLREADRGEVEASVVDGRVVLSVAADYAGEWMYLYAFSDPTGLGWQQVTVAGELTVPTAELEAGAHRFALMDADGLLLGWVEAEVPGADATATPEADEGAEPGSGLPVAGIVALAVAVVAVVLVVAWALRRRAAR